jgi:hypothetical protein
MPANLVTLRSSPLTWCSRKYHFTEGLKLEQFLATFQSDKHLREPAAQWKRERVASRFFHFATVCV